MIKSILFFSIVLSFVSCGQDSLNLPTPSITAKTPAAWELISVYQMSPSEGRFTYKFGFTQKFRLWSRGSSDSKTNQMMYSDNFGKSWQFINLPDGGIGGDGAIRFIDSRYGWAMDSSTVLRTDDGGMSWEKVQLPPKSKINNLDSMEFTDANHGYIAGSTTLMDRGMGTMNFGIEILCTSDGGESWSVCYKNHVNNTTLKMVSSGNLTMALVDQKTLLMTGDGGATWKEKHWEFPATDIEAAPNGALWTTGEDGFLRSSADLGDSWQIIPVKSSKNAGFKWTSVSFDTNGVGVAVGSQGVVAATVDEGRSWKLQSDLSLNADLWTVRVQHPYVAISDETRLSVFHMGE